MNDRDREEARLEEIRRRARELRRQPEDDTERPPQPSSARAAERRPAVASWRPAAAGPVGERREAGGERRAAWSPPTRVFDRDGTMIVRFELPGLDRKDVDVRVEDQVLVVEGERQDDRPQDGGRRSDWGYGPFRREIALPHHVDPSAVTGSFRNGLLEVAVPGPRRDERRKRIKVEAA